MAKAQKGGPKFAVGDRVLLRNQPGTIKEVPEYDEAHLALHGQLYTVEMLPWEKEEYADKHGATQVRYRNLQTSETRGHAADTFGCVSEADLTARK